MKLSSYLIAGAAAALLPFGAAIAQSPTPEQPAAPPAQESSQGATFESLDADSDGRISKDEAAVNANVTAQFARYDKNGNGFIEKDEVASSNTTPPSEPGQK